ncbi:MAG: hypothetical protein D3914_08535 [Candidatus Electrothrix sp. LOE2]|nr:hypothetical protein [Candidatus Electrothrix sp. LOE2]
MENPWDDIADLQPEVENPINIVKTLFSPLYEKTQEKVIYKLEQVYFFPEEVKRSLPILLAFEMPEPSPDFGYDPEEAKKRQYFRYRLLLSPTANGTVEYELFKFKFPLFFYPVQFFIDHIIFKGLSGFVDEKSEFVMANNEQELYTIISTIIRAESTIKLIKRLMAL